MDNILEVRNLSKKFPGFSLKDLSFELPCGYISFPLMSPRTLISLFNIPWDVPPLTVEAAAGGAAGLFLLTSFALPLLFIFGYIKTRMITMFLFLGAFFLPSAIQGARESEASWLRQLLGNLQSQSDTVLITYFLICSATFWLFQ